MDTPVVKVPPRRRGDPPWEIAMIFPEQGYWDEHDFFSLPNTRGVEFDDGMIEVLPAPKKTHELIVIFLFELIKAYVLRQFPGGVVFPSGFKVRIPSRKFRQPDIIFMTAGQSAAANEDFTNQAELVVEIVGEDDPNRDDVVKREEYALAAVRNIGSSIDTRDAFWFCVWKMGLTWNTADSSLASTLRRAGFQGLA